MFPSFPCTLLLRQMKMCAIYGKQFLFCHLPDQMLQTVTSRKDTLETRLTNKFMVNLYYQLIQLKLLCNVCECSYTILHIWCFNVSNEDEFWKYIFDQDKQHDQIFQYISSVVGKYHAWNIKRRECHMPSNPHVISHVSENMPLPTE